jgi:AcrR family transcriptional regulator
MPAPLLHRNEMLDRLLATLRDKGYDGASLADLSAATGLAKSSLYHSFPGGKEEIALKVLEHLDAQLTASLFAPLRAKLPPARKLAALLVAIDEHYDGGRTASILERLGASADRLAFRRALGHAFGGWLAAVEGLCLEAGLPKAVARARAEELVVRIEGALVVAAGTGDHGVFTRTLSALRRSLLAPATDD